MPSKHHYQRYRQQTIEYNRQWRKRNPQYAKIYRMLHPEVEKRRIRDPIERYRNMRKRDNILRRIVGSHLPEQWMNLIKRFRFRCLKCGRNAKLTADHVLPISQGGTDYIHNIQPLCNTCNASKGPRFIAYIPDLQLPARCITTHAGEY